MIFHEVLLELKQVRFIRIFFEPGFMNTDGASLRRSTFIGNAVIERFLMSDFVMSDLFAGMLNLFIHGIIDFSIVFMNACISASPGLNQQARQEILK
jgi:hypothetical protein